MINLLVQQTIKIIAIYNELGAVKAISYMIDTYGMTTDQAVEILAYYDTACEYASQLDYKHLTAL